MISETLRPPEARFCTSARVAASISASIAFSNAGEVCAAAGADSATRPRASGAAQAKAMRVKVMGCSFYQGRTKSLRAGAIAADSARPALTQRAKLAIGARPE